MKVTKLLVLSALLLVCSYVRASVPDNVRQKPTIAKTQGFEVSETTDTYFYLYNVNAKAFFTEGNAWGTQASVGSSGLKVAFTEDGGAYLFNDYTNAKGAWMYCFFDSPTAMYVDHGSQANYHWGVEKGDGTFRLYAASAEGGNPGWDDGATPAYQEGMYVGLDASGTSTALSPYLSVADDHYIDWAFVAEADYDVYNAANQLYEAAEALKPVLEEAESLGANIADELAVYKDANSTVEALNKATEELKAINEARKPLKAALDEAKAAGFTETAEAETVFNNGDATVAELQTALENLKNAMVEWGKGHASVDHPADMSAKIKNPNFDNASSTGWSGTAPNMVGSGSHGPANVAEVWNNTFDTYQDIEDLPAGVYALSAQTMWRGSYPDMISNIGPASKLYVVAGEQEVSVPFNYAYAPLNTTPLGGNTSWGVGAGETSYTDDEAGVTYYIPNDPSAFRVYAELGLYDTKVLFGTTDGKIRIGVKNPAMMGDADNWSCFDTFTLTYYGADADAAELYLAETIKNYSEMTIEEGTIFTESYLTAYNEALKQDISVASFDDVATAMAGIEAAKKAIDDNIDLWKKWQAAVAEARNNYVLNDQYQGLAAMDDLADYCDDMNTEPILDDRAFTNEELQAEIDKIAAMVEAVKEESLNADHEDGDDMTQFIVNPGFEEGIERATDPNGTSGDYGTATGWHADKYANGNFTPGPLGSDMNHCFEAWHCHNFDLWQEIENLPRGMYELNVQGYVRCEVAGYNRGDDILPDYPSPIVLYMNSATSEFPSVYSEQFPEDVEKVTVETWSWDDAVGDVTYPNSMGAAGQCFAQGMYKVQAFGLIAKKGDKFRIGVKMDADQDWWTIFDNFKLTYRKPTAEIVQPILEKELEKLDLSQAMGSEVFDNVATTRKLAEDAIASGDGEQMFDALVQVYDASDAIRASVNKFKELETSLDAMAGKMAEAQVASIKAEAQTLYDQVNTGIADHTIATDDIDGLKNDIAKMINRLGLPEGMENASDDNRVECTTVIINPSYIDGNDNGWTGKASINGDAMDAEKFNTAFNYYQVLQGLPAGTYQVTVQGFYRAGFANEDYDAYIADPTASNNAFLYAIGEGQTYSTPLQRLASEPIAMETLADGYAWASEANQLAAPNSMTTAGDMFLTFNDATGKNYYANNVLTAKVGEDGVLTIGLKKDELIASDWTIWTNWQLFYYGTSSSLEPNDDPSGIKAVNGNQAVKVEFFNLNGARISKPMKGVAIMRQQMRDGSVKVSKVLMK